MGNDCGNCKRMFEFSGARNSRSSGVYTANEEIVVNLHPA
jgi:hypothetical protein